MNQSSRIKNSKKNIVIGLAIQIILTVVSFLTRMVFVKILGEQYLGINGLYTNILTILSAAELGIGNVLVYSLYKPIYEGDKEKLRSLLQYYKWLYRGIALVVTVVGLLLIPVLPYIIDSTLPQKELVLYYVFYLLNSVVSYFVIYKTSLINADQKYFVIKLVNMLSMFAQYVLQILVLLVKRDYLLYLSIHVGCTILNNVILNIIADRMYPYLKEKKKPEPLKKADRIFLWDNIKATFIYKISAVIINNTDNILVSILIGTVFVGYYSNYSLVISTIVLFLGIVTNAILPSLGNLNAEGDKEKSLRIFRALMLFYAVTVTFVSGGMLAAFKDFITLSFGEAYNLDGFITLSIVMNFYVANIVSPLWMYRETMGLFKQVRFVILITAVLNIILSIVLGMWFGMAGIFFATAISRILTLVWYEPKILYRLKFESPVSEYWKLQLKYVAVSAIDFFAIHLICKNMTEISFSGMCLKVIISSCIVLGSFFVVSYRTGEFRTMKRFVFEKKSNG